MTTKRIFKYPWPVSAGSCRIKMPVGAKVLHFGVQHDIPTIWALVDPESPDEERLFALFGTGAMVIGPFTQYLGTVIMHGDSLVLHLFEPERT